MTTSAMSSEAPLKHPYRASRAASQSPLLPPEQSPKQSPEQPSQQTPEQPFVPNWHTMPEAFDTPNPTRQQALRKARLQVRLFTILTIAFALLGLSAISYPYIMQYVDSVRQANLSSTVESNVAAWPTEKVRAALRSAQNYNKRLFEQGQPIIGENTDPFESNSGHSSTKPDEELASTNDPVYMNELNESHDGIMASVEVPKISLNLPIYHGTGVNALNRGAGHLYGTSLPVGGVNTHTVLSGHRGMVAALMFTRIDELTRGDLVYIHVLGETLAYEIDSIRTILPTEGEKYMRIVPGEDRITLLTCTPYGVNTHRLLVSGKRVALPASEAAARSVDVRLITRWVLLGTLAVASLLCLLVWSRRERWAVMRHAANRCGL